jgi:hypothetical protein
MIRLKPVDHDTGTFRRTPDGHPQTECRNAVLDAEGGSAKNVAVVLLDPGLGKPRQPVVCSRRACAALLFKGAGTPDCDKKGEGNDAPEDAGHS